MKKTWKIGLLSSALCALLAFFMPMKANAQHSYLSAYELSLFSALIPRDSAEDQTLAWLLATDPSMDWRKEQALSERLDRQISKLSLGRDQNQRDFLLSVYRWARKTYLKHYGEYYTLAETLQWGEYNCVSGTALLAYTLQKLGYEYQIRETNKHVYLLVKIGNSKILIESTDPFNGFIEGNDEVVARIQQYNNQYVGASTLVQHEGSLYVGELKINRNIDLKKLAGLQYFNVAVRQYASANFKDAAFAVKKAEYLYTSQRNKSLLLLLANR